MILISNLVYQVFPNLPRECPQLCTLITNQTNVSEVVDMYDRVVIRGQVPKNFPFAAVSRQLEGLVEEIYKALNIKYQFSYAQINGQPYKHYQIIRGREVDVYRDLAMDDINVKVALKYAALLRSASNRGLPFNLRMSDVKALLLRKTCYFTNTPFGKDGDKRTFDRLDCNKGYVRGNVVVCTEEVNQMKEHFFEHIPYDPDKVNQLFFKYFTLVAEGKIQPKKA